VTLHQIRTAAISINFLAPNSLSDLFITLVARLSVQIKAMHSWSTNDIVESHGFSSYH
jgi:hypothetical protein